MSVPSYKFILRPELWNIYLWRISSGACHSTASGVGRPSSAANLPHGKLFHAMAEPRVRAAHSLILHTRKISLEAGEWLPREIQLVINGVCLKARRVGIWAYFPASDAVSVLCHPRGIYITLSKAQGTSQKSRWRQCKRQRLGRNTTKQCLLVLVWQSWISSSSGCLHRPTYSQMKAHTQDMKVWVIRNRRGLKEGNGIIIIHYMNVWNYSKLNYSS